MQVAAPVPLRKLCPAAPASLEAIILRALQKDPANRFQELTPMLDLLQEIDLAAHIAEPCQFPSAKSTVVDPHASGGFSHPPSAGSERTSIAVLPFLSLSPDPEDKYLAVGISSEVILALNGVPSLRVSPQLASFRLPESVADPVVAGHMLNCRYVVTGSVRRGAGRIRVTVELTDTLQERVVSSRNYDHDWADVFVLQEDISKSIVSSLGGELIRSNTDVAFRVATENLDAWGLVRKAYHIWNHEFTPAGVGESLGMLRRAVELDPQYPTALAYLAFYLLQAVLHGISPNPDADTAEAIDSAARAAALAPDDPEVLQCLTLVWLKTSRFPEAVRCGRRAVRVAPFDLVAWGYLALALASAGDDAQVQESAAILNKLIAEAPDHPSLPYWLQFLTSAYIRQNRYADAAACGRRCVELQPGYTLQQMLLAEALWQLGDKQEARAIVASIPSYNPFFTFEHYTKILTNICVSPDIVHHFTRGLQQMFSQSANAN
jgi:adenylate cyclase